MPNVTYPLDTTGISPSNLIVDELHTLTEINASTYRLLVPEFSPFYLDNFVLKHTDINGVESILTPDVDYIFTLPYLAGSRSIAKMLYGAISVSNLLIDGTVSLTYQTLGGDWIADRALVLQRLAEFNYNPIVSTWDNVTNIQEIFPPINHDQSMDYVMGHTDLINAINAIRDAIIDGPNLTPALIDLMANPPVNEGISRAEMYYLSKSK